jgi:uncharacterized protein YkwD
MAFTAVKQRPKHPKKRVGQHHKHTQHYVKHYWPYLPMAFIAAAGILVSSLWPSQLGVLGANTDLGSQALLNSTNEQRISADESLLALNEQLSEAAQAKADDMVAHDYWSHTTPDGQAPWSFITASGYTYQKAGENLAYGFDSASSTVNAWMHSPSHRDNILNHSYRDVGFGIAHSADFAGNGEATVIVAMYGLAGDMTSSVYSQSSSPSGVQGRSIETVPVSRLATIQGQPASLLPMFASLILVLVVVTFVIRHGRFLHRTLVRGEQLALRHPVLDFALVTIMAAGFVISRTAGFIA